jgi:hypothetical protein
MRLVKTTLCAFTLAVMPLQASAATIISNATLGLYNNGIGDIHAIDGPFGFLPGPNVSEGDPTIVLGADPNLTFPAAFGADWLGGNYTGGAWSAGLVAIPSGWAINTETAIVYNFTLATASSLHIDLGVDNGILVWLNGSFLFGATAPGGSFISEYDIDIASLAAGSHSLQILRADHGGSQDYDIQVDATAVPEPATLLLTVMSLAGVGMARRRKTRS